MAEQIKPPPPWDQSPESEAGSFGGWLRQQREIREISLREIAETSKISLRYLEALEQDRFDLLPAHVFAKGFLREYAKFVGLDPDDVVNYYLAARQKLEPAEEPMDPQPTTITTPSHWTYVLSIAAGVVLLFGLVAAVSYYVERARAGAEQMPTMAAPSVARPAAEDASVVEPVAVVKPLRVTLDFTQNCWVEAFVDGERSVSELRVQGESLGIEAEQQIRLTLGNVAGVGVEINGRPYLLATKDGEEIEIDLTMARALEEGQS